MDEKRLQQLIDRFQRNAQKNYDNYQSTGEQKYYRQFINSEEMADICNIALNANDDHIALISLKTDVRHLALKTEKALLNGDNKEIETAAKDFIQEMKWKKLI